MAQCDWPGLLRHDPQQGYGRKNRPPCTTPLPCRPRAHDQGEAKASLPSALLTRKILNFLTHPPKGCAISMSAHLGNWKYPKPHKISARLQKLVEWCAWRGSNPQPSASEADTL